MFMDRSYKLSLHSLEVIFFRKRKIQACKFYLEGERQRECVAESSKYQNDKTIAIMN